MGTNVLHYLHPQSQPVVVEAFAAIVEPGTARRLEFRFRHGDGRWRWFDATGRSFLSPDGEVHAVIISRDVTEHKRAAEELARSRTELHARTEALSVIQSIAEALSRTLELDEVADTALQELTAFTGFPFATFYEVEAKEGVARLLASRGLEPEMVEAVSVVPLADSLIGQAKERDEVVSVQDLANDPRTSEATRPALQNLGLGTGLMVPAIFRGEVLGMIALAGTGERDLSLLDRDTLAATGRSVGAALANARYVERLEREIRVRETAEAALRSSRADLEARSESLAMLNTVADALYRSFDPGTVARRAVDSVRACTGFSTVALFSMNERDRELALLAETGAGSALRDSLRHYAQPDPAEALPRARCVVPLADPRSDPRLAAPVRADLEAAGVCGGALIPLLYHDEPVGLLALFARDPDELSAHDEETLLSLGRTVAAALANARYVERIEAETRAREELREQLRQSQKMEAIGRLAGGVAHDFNNMLTVISGYGELLLDDLDPADPRREAAEEILVAAHRASALTRQLLVFSRKQIRRPLPLSLNEVVDRLEKMLRRLIGEDVELLVRPTPGIGWVRADPSQIEQVVVNLAVNARDAMPEGGRLELRTREVELDASHARTHPDVEPGRYVRLSVSDTGRGMDAETCARIFEPFFTTKESGKGTGLGLSTAYGIVRQSGGHIRVFSAPGGGTRVEIDLPRASPEAGEASGVAPAPRVEASGTETLLLVEDEEHVRVLARRILEAQGYRVLEASNGLDALRIAGEHEGGIDLLVTDVVMPQMGGIDLATELRRERPDLRVLYVSGYLADEAIRLEQAESGALLVPKPFTPAVLVSAVREALDA